MANRSDRQQHLHARVRSSVRTRGYHSTRPQLRGRNDGSTSARGTRQPPATVIYKPTPLRESAAGGKPCHGSGFSRRISFDGLMYAPTPRLECERRGPRGLVPSGRLPARRQALHPHPYTGVGPIRRPSVYESVRIGRTRRWLRPPTPIRRSYIHLGVQIGTRTHRRIRLPACRDPTPLSV